MLWIIYQVDREGAQAIRDATRAAHLAYLDEHEEIVFLGGALLADDARRIGSCLIINVPDRATAEHWSQNEPFRKAGLFSSVTITRMRKGQYNPAAAPKSAEGD
jgi:uncharacterized protein YciI